MNIKKLRKDSFLLQVLHWTPKAGRHHTPQLMAATLRTTTSTPHLASPECQPRQLLVTEEGSSCDHQASGVAVTEARGCLGSY
ncbi:hypothetical protein E2C01_031752 [Portunus trituberculatus]|uniref:Uncharacterized protein n=1 Tax=Portunus trituberculatus TaxID=210409 RepID=A0A5B7EYN5_PORTR|nr:hypothetical protein [Portunus trituberculatus]